MATSSRLRGNVNPIFTLKLGAAAAVSYSDDLKKVSLTSEDKDDSDLTFAEAAAGLAKDWTVTLTGIVSHDATALYAYLWDNPGAEWILTYGPWGNASPSATKPHYQITVKNSGKPAFETEAKSPNDVTGAEFEHELFGKTDVVKLTA